ncbi:flagellar biosynthesis regulator FlaF [Paracoccus caeni]|uniref:flagellar biosynthesis regulator FlaF n=1 Tax=Paracoccus caeni TaxID=657651 RepID=UPI002D7FF699|nr:flagellar biosynthesis regulator FlaF [Paracoccus caeni]
MTPLSQNGYGTPAVRTARDSEYDVFSRITRMLRQADTTDDRRAMIDAVHKNNQLWTILATDLAETGNLLPDDVKAGLISLAAFSLRHGHAVLAGRAEISALIDVNVAVMKGLRGEVAV